MLISGRGYNWNNVLSPNWWAHTVGGLVSGRAYDRDFVVYVAFF